MEQNFCISLSIFCVFQSMMAFNIDPVTWRNFPNPSQSQKTAFGYKIIQEKSSLIVSDPLFQMKDQSGRIYSCPVTLPGSLCNTLDIKVPAEAVNMSLGLSMVQDPSTSKLMICGPTIPKKCESITTYNGVCFVGQSFFPESARVTIPSSLRDCSGQIDIAFLLDGSGSVGRDNFDTMKTFVKNMINRFSGRDAQFAIAQYSRDCTIEYNFKQLNTDLSKREYMVSIINYQYGPATFTAAAIIKVVKDLFTIFQGARPSATRILVVITDGQSNDRDTLKYASNEASRKNITSIAIGVGSAFSSYEAKNELNTIATDPDTDHVFRVGDFVALTSILQKLEENIIAIEGTQTSGDSSRMEFAQDGFSAAFTSHGSVLLSVPGAYQWKGGYQEYGTNSNGQVKVGSEHDSYLGYSMAIATVSGMSYVILGAPRYQHKGQVVILNTQSKLDSPKPQIGSYFGAEVCVVDLNSDGNTDLLLVSAPTYIEMDGEGKVFVYNFQSNGPYFTSLDTELVGMVGQKGRFGSSIASPADLNRDGINDIVIGAPLEDNGQGSIYIFNGKDRGISSTYSQRIGGSSVQSGLRFFGISISQSSFDQSKDNLPDIAVGSIGAVLILRSRPIMILETKVTYNPPKISTSVTDCTQPLKQTMRVCFTMSQYKHTVLDLAANIAYTVTLDAKRLIYRAYFNNAKNRTINNVTMLQGRGEACKDHIFLIEACPDDALNPLSNQLTVRFEGLPSNSEQGLKPVLSPKIRNTTDHDLEFEINCGTDNKCTDELRIDFNFTGSTNIEVGIMQEINVTVFLENRGENSYNTYFTLKYPFGLSYRRSTSKQGRVECASRDADQEVLGETGCHINKPIFKGNSEVVFEITYSISKESTFGQNVKFTADVKSGNTHSDQSVLFKEKTIGVKYAIYIALIRHENSSIHINFTAGKWNLNKPIKQILRVENDLRELNFTVDISVPIKLGDLDIWTTSDFQIAGCERKKLEPQLAMTKQEVMDLIKKHRVVNCSVAVCAVFTCNVKLMRNERILYNVSGNVSSGWIQQTDLKAAVFELVSTASLDYDKRKYVFFSTESRNTAPTLQIITQVEVYEMANLTKEIIGGVIGGLLLIALITLALYKAGFFKSQYKQMLEEAQGAEGADGGNTAQ